MTISLFPPARGVAEGATEVDEVRVGAEEGVCAFSAARINAGVTTGDGVLRGFDSSFEVEEDDARSIAPRSTSNRDRTSPVCAAIFLVRSVIVGSGKNFFASALTAPSLSNRGLRRVCRISSSWEGSYGAKWRVRIPVIPCVLNCDCDEVRVWVFAIPMMRRDEELFGRENRVTREEDEAAMWSSSSKTSTL